MENLTTDIFFRVKFDWTVISLGTTNICSLWKVRRNWTEISLIVKLITSYFGWAPCWRRSYNWSSDVWVLLSTQLTQTQYCQQIVGACLSVTVKRDPGETFSEGFRKRHHFVFVFVFVFIWKMRINFSSEIVTSDALQSTNLELFQTLVTQDFSFLSYSMFCLPKACFPRGFTGLCRVTFWHISRWRWRWRCLVLCHFLMQTDKSSAIGRFPGN